jgi:hypothetical protein
MPASRSVLQLATRSVEFSSAGDYLGRSASWRAKEGCDFGSSKRAEMSFFYHLLWFWDGDDLPVGLFCQKFFLLDAGVVRFLGRSAGVGRDDNCAHRMGTIGNAGA